MCCTLSAHLAFEGPLTEIPHILPTFILNSLKVRISLCILLRARFPVWKAWVRDLMLPLRCKWGFLLSSECCTAVVGGYRLFGTAYRSRLLGPLKLGPICHPEMSVTLAMNAAQYPEERIPQEGTDVFKVSYRIHRLYQIQLLGKYHYCIDMIALCVPASAMLTLRSRWRPIECALFILIEYGVTHGNLTSLK
jgi:hypothetical protein